MRTKLQKNTIIGIVSQITTFICGFIIPRIILESYGSDVNGLVASITNFLAFISLAECGIGAVVQSALYKPLANKDEDEINRILVSSDSFFNKVGIILLAYVVLMFFVYPSFVDDTFGFEYVAFLVLIISISTFIEHYVCMSYRLLLTADQTVYILLIYQIITQVLIVVFSVILARLNVSIHVFKLVSSLILFIRPIGLSAYVKRHYRINRKVTMNGEPIKQKWNGLYQHIAYVVLNNTDTVVLTIFSSLNNVSIYQVYFLVVNGLKMFISSALTGVQSFLGNLYAKEDMDGLNSFYEKYEWIIHTIVTFIFSCSCILIVPFVKIYTQGIEDANYIVPTFGIAISLAQMSYCLRLPYNAMVFAAGHYKETQNSAIIEAILNVFISIISVSKFGLVGVALGTLFSMLYRTVYLAWYLNNNIIYRSFKEFLKHLFIDVIVVVISLVISRFITISSTSYFLWCLDAVKVALILGTITVVINVFSYINLLKKHFTSNTKLG